MIQRANSPISASEPDARRWRRFLAAFALAAVLGLACLYALVVALDPFDTGRFSVFGGTAAVQPTNPAKTSRGRDPAFDAAIIGNSRIQLLRPSLLRDRTGMNFVSLIINGSQPKEQFVVLDWFLQHHVAPRAIVIGLDETWCFDPLRSAIAFPRWLYDGKARAYFVGLFRFQALRQIFGRAAGYFGLQQQPRPDGFIDYDALFRNFGWDDVRIVHQKVDIGRPMVPYTSERDLPALPPLRERLQKLPTSTAVVLVWPPTHINVVPQPGSRAEAALRMCHDAYAALAQERPRSRIVDWAVDRPESRVEENFFDRVHYRTNVATALGEDIAAALNAIQVPP